MWLTPLIEAPTHFIIYFSARRLHPGVADEFRHVLPRVRHLVEARHVKFEILEFEPAVVRSILAPPHDMAHLHVLPRHVFPKQLEGQFCVQVVREGDYQAGGDHREVIEQ